jgi:hypothetical protein
VAFVAPGWFASVAWATREDETDPDSPLVEIRPGELDTEATALARLWYQFQGETEWTRLLGLVGEVFGLAEHGLGSVSEARSLSTAEGDVLDAIGAIVNRARSGLSDDLYRLAIRAEAGSIFASGTIPEILELTRSLMGDGVRVRELWPATILIKCPDVAADVFMVLLEILADVPAAGVGALLSTWTDADVGGYASRTGPTTREAGRYGSTTGVSDSRSWYATGQPIGGE